MDNNQYQTDTALSKRTVVGGNHAAEETQEIDLLILFNALRRHIMIIIAVALVFALVAGIYVQFFITPLYTATTSTYLASVSGNALLQIADLNIANNIAPDYSDIIKSRAILAAVIEQMELPYSYGQLYSKVNVQNPTDTHIIKITVTDPDPYLARDIANNLTYYAIECLPDIMEIDISTSSIYDTAVAATSPSSPNLTKSVMIAFAVGAVLAAGVIVFITIMDTTIKTSEDIENRCGLVTLTKVYYEGGKRKKGYGYDSYKNYGYGYGYYSHTDSGTGGKSKTVAKSGKDNPSKDNLLKDSPTKDSPTKDNPTPKNGGSNK